MRSLIKVKTNTQFEPGNPDVQMLETTSNIDKKTTTNEQLRPMLLSSGSLTRSRSHAQALAAER
jgi:hypothetical protein